MNNKGQLIDKILKAVKAKPEEFHNLVDHSEEYLKKLLKVIKSL